MLGAYAYMDNKHNLQINGAMCESVDTFCSLDSIVDICHMY